MWGSRCGGADVGKSVWGSRCGETVVGRSKGEHENHIKHSSERYTFLMLYT